MGYTAGNSEGKGFAMIYDLQKASMWKRISAGMFDGILLGVVAVLFAWLLSIALGFDVHYQALNDSYARYGEEYGVSFDMSLTDYETMTEETAQALDAAYAALGQDEAAVYAWNMVLQLTLTIASLGIFLAFLVMEFTVPMVLGNGQTLGKKMFGIGLMRTDGVQVNGIAMFVRTALGKYAVETMIPVLILIMLYFNMIGLTGTAVLGLMLIVQAVLVLATRRNALLHDCLASTVCIDVGSQMIFKSREAMIAYKEKAHAEQAARAPY